MMSMFRKPGEDSDSSFEDSCEQTEHDDEQSHQDPVLSRIQTLESAASVQSSTTTRPQPRMDVRQGSAQDVRDLMLHALLEEKAINDTAKQYGKDISDPEVQRRGRELYQEIARQIANNVDDTYASDALRSHRATAQAGISQLTQSNLNRLAVAPPGSSTSRALVARTSSNLNINIPQQPSPGFELLSGLSAPATLHLRGYPGLQTDRYAREFSELAMVGKGGYGRVYKAKHKLDGSIYAVKRIPISPAKLARVQEHGPQELESLLEEVRSLARFEHMNIVRYHNAWLEFTTMPSSNPMPSTTTVLRNDRLLEGVPMLSTSPMRNNFLPSEMTDLSRSERTSMNEDTYGDGIVFENSDTGGNTERSRNDTDSHSFRAQLRKSAKLRNRRGSQASQATIATLSSTKSRMSAVEDVDEEDEEDDIEMIPRSHVAYSEEKTSDLSESMVSQSDVPGHMVPLPTTGPILTLNVQMSLCETNLATFVSADQFQLPSQGVDRHCFHPFISLELLQHIISGVQYLHSKGVVHRDLKPANVFLSFSNSYHAPYGSVDVSTCKSCTDRASLHVTPRIGDFGLVAALSDSCAATDSTIKPVGTEFYRPDISSRICEKLDVFALGVIGFEMLEKFGTRMERIAALGALRHGTFPVDFASNIGSRGSRVQYLISGMVHVNENERLSCEEVRREISRLLLESQS